MLNSRALLIALTAIASILASGVRADDRSLVDAVFAGYDSTHNPGCALGVYRDGAIEYARGYGMANLEYDIAISPDSVFRIASTSKQFVAFAIALLDEAGELDLDDPVQKYFPKMPDYGQPVTLRHMIHHTSGIRDYLALADLAEWSHFSNAQALAIIERQQALNFAPGSDYMYSNSGYYLLGEVVRKVTSKSLRDWSDENMFKPLGMHHTHFHDDHTQLVPNRADGHQQDDDGVWRISMTQLDMVGDGGVFTTVNDLVKWNNNFYDNQLGKGRQSLIKALETPAQLNDGTAIDYAFGLGVGEYMGTREISHGGSFVGYRSGFNRYPEKNLGVAVLCNDASANPDALAREVASIYLSQSDSMETTSAYSDETEHEQTLETIELDEATLAHYAGKWWYPDQMMARTTLVENGKLFYDRGWSRTELLPLAGEPHRFALEGMGAQYVVTFPAPDSKDNQLSFATLNGPTRMAIKLDPAAGNGADLAALAGEYYSPELDHRLKLELADGALITRWQEDPHELETLFGDTLAAASVVFEFQRNSEARVTGFLMSSGRVRNLAYEKISQ